jgi:hypothetical protein
MFKIGMSYCLLEHTLLLHEDTSFSVYGLHVLLLHLISIPERTPMIIMETPIYTYIDVLLGILYIDIIFIINLIIHQNRILSHFENNIVIYQKLFSYQENLKNLYINLCINLYLFY